MELMPTAFEKSLKKQIICLKILKRALHNCLPNFKTQENNKTQIKIWPYDLLVICDFQKYL